MISEPDVASRLYPRWFVAGREHVYAIDTSSGVLTWRRELARARALAWHSGVLIVAGLGGTCALDAASGAVRWAQPGAVTYLRVVDGEIYAVGSRTPLHSRDASTGIERWRTTEGLGEEWCSLYASESYVLMLSGYACAFDRADGSRLSSVGLGSSGQLSATIFQHDDRLLGTGREVAFSFSVGQPDRVLWLLPLAGMPETSLLAGGALCFSSGNPAEVIALEAADGRLRWRARVDGHLATDLATVGNLLCVASDTGVIRSLYTADGATAWLTPIPCSWPRLRATKDAVYAVNSSACRVSSDGELLWAHALPSSANIAELTANHLLLTSFGRVVALDRETGTESWALALPDVEASAPKLLHD